MVIYCKFRFALSGKLASRHARIGIVGIMGFRLAFSVGD